VKRPVSVAAAKHLLSKLAEYRAQAEAKFPEAHYSRSDRESFVLAMLEGHLQFHADPLGG
jgi:hypothetical protein